MKAHILASALCAVALTILVQPADAQRAGQAGQQGEAEAAQPAEVRLVYEREVFAYRPAGRRDPFRPLTDDDEMGPRFEQLALRAVIHDTGQRNSLAMLADGSGRVYRVREGDVIGNARVVEIGPSRVVMAVETFGTIRQEMLELPRRGGAQR
jgi:hypothetical protein